VAFDNPAATTARLSKVNSLLSLLAMLQSSSQPPSWACAQNVSRRAHDRFSRVACMSYAVLR
jgi:hypothetical protein